LLDKLIALTIDEGRVLFNSLSCQRCPETGFAASAQDSLTACAISSAKAIQAVTAQIATAGQTVASKVQFWASRRERDRGPILNRAMFLFSPVGSDELPVYSSRLLQGSTTRPGKTGARGCAGR